MNPLDIIAKYYPVGSEAYRILVIHSRSVADKALAIARMHPEMNLDLTFVEEAAMLHVSVFSVVMLPISIVMEMRNIFATVIWGPN